MRYSLLFLSMMFPSLIAYCCDCAPASDARGFCTVVSEAKSRPMFCIAEARVLSYHAWGMYVEVLDNIYNTATADTILVWGDNGACCRPSITGGAAINIGDTLVMSLEQTDFMGNLIAPSLPDLEDASHYMLGGCGAHYLRYHTGRVSGFITTYAHPDTMNYDAFKTMVSGCITASAVAGTPTQNKIGIFPNPATEIVDIQSTSLINELILLNGLGQEIAHYYPSRKMTALDLRKFPAGIYTLILYTDDRQKVSYHKVAKQ